MYIWAVAIACCLVCKRLPSLINSGCVSLLPITGFGFITLIEKDTEVASIWQRILLDKRRLFLFKGLSRVHQSLSVELPVLVLRGVPVIGCHIVQWLKLSLPIEEADNLVGIVVLFGSALINPIVEV